jgi:hypothetical protein
MLNVISEKCYMFFLMMFIYSMDISELIAVKDS